MAVLFVLDLNLPSLTVFIACLISHSKIGSSYPTFSIFLEKCPMIVAGNEKKFMSSL
jgi:hypothetical protein